MTTSYLPSSVAIVSEESVLCSDISYDFNDDGSISQMTISDAWSGRLREYEAIYFRFSYVEAAR